MPLGQYKSGQQYDITLKNFICMCQDRNEGSTCSFKNQLKIPQVQQGKWPLEKKSLFIKKKLRFAMKDHLMQLSVYLNFIVPGSIST